MRDPSSSIAPPWIARDHRPNRVESHRVDINTAKCWELRAIRGIGPKTAEAIVKCRTRRGDFENVDALVRVDGIAEKTVERLRPYLTASTRGTPDGKED